MKLALNNTMNRPIALLIVLVLVPLFSQGRYASASTDNNTKSEIQSLEAIAAAVETFAKAQHAHNNDVTVSVRSLDSRLRLAKCNEPLQTNWSPGSRPLGRVTAQVACVSPKPWRIHVNASVTMKGTVWTLARGVRRGDSLSMALVEQQEITLGSNNTGLRSLGTPVLDIKPWLGFEFQQAVGTGKVLSEGMLKPPILISKGDAVVIRHIATGLELQTRGVALKDAYAQEQTQVRNTSSGKVIDVVAVRPGVVEILR